MVPRHLTSVSTTTADECTEVCFLDLLELGGVLAPLALLSPRSAELPL